MNSVRCMASGMSLKVQPYVLAVGGGNGSCRLTGLWQTVRGASNPITANNCYGNWWSEKYTTTGRGRWLPARSWTNDCTAHDQTTPEPKVKVPYSHLECQNYVSNRQDRTGGKENVALPISILGIIECRWTGSGCVTTSQPYVPSTCDEDYVMLSYLILSYLILSYLILSYLILSYVMASRIYMNI